MEKIINEIIENISKSVEKKGRFVQFNDKDYKPVEISKDNFKIIEGEGEGRIAFIDGGNSEILKASNFSLQLIRVYYCIYENNKRVKGEKHEFYVLVYAENKGHDIVYNVKTFGTDLSFNEFNSFDKTLSQGEHRVEVSSIGEAVRKFAEIDLMHDLIGLLSKGDVIVRDGDLQSTITGEQERYDKVFEKAYEKGVIIAGLSKTSQLFTDSGNSAVETINSISPEGAWLYHPVARIENKKHKAEMSFVKLNEKSRYVLRFELYIKQKEDMKNVLILLKQNSKDPVFLGYPYGLIEADKFARVSNQEKQYLLIRFMTKSGDNWKKISAYLNTVNAHSILDNLS